MVLLNEGLNRIRDLVSTDVSTLTLGTGTTAATAADTDLETKDTDTAKTVTDTKTDKQIKFDYTLLSTEGNTSTYSEMKLHNATYDYDRVVFAGITWTKNGSANLVVTKRYFFRAG